MPEPGSSNGRSVVLGKETLVPLGTLGGVVMVIVGGVVQTMRIDNRQERLEEWLVRQDSSLQEVKVGIEELRETLRDGYVSRDLFSLYLELLRARNPDVDVPGLPGQR